MSPEEELLVGVFSLDDAEMDEAGQEANDNESSIRPLS